MPVTVPEVEIPAIAVFALLHTPPPTASNKVVLLPAQTTGAAGDIAVGLVFTFTIAVAEQPPTV